MLRAVTARANADPLAESDALRQLIELDTHDEPAHLGLIEAVRSIGAHGQARATRERYLARMADLGVPPPAPSVLDR